jgi:hypothetical protein
MARNISFALTTDQFLNRSKSVTRRKGWKFLKAGDTLNACVKVMGFRPGETIERLGQIRVADVREEPLRLLIDDPDYGQAEATREGFPQMTGHEFAAMFIEHMGGDLDQTVTRIEFEYAGEEASKR